MPLSAGCTIAMKWCTWSAMMFRSPISPFSLEYRGYIGNSEVEKPYFLRSSFLGQLCRRQLEQFQGQTSGQHTMTESTTAPSNPIPTAFLIWPPLQPSMFPTERSG
ncbi:hypothetical protein DPEC_G00244990 [Dallia pectoralis]|uniref:Uncharacterized protein n=1 Tax=Dallia pectoralis TaxID=75939 RepID=A0ACC2FW58_DALPE|nr:hypothetical protein DPEC_G00244990 [Dallia pectoralis]